MNNVSSYSGFYLTLRVQVPNHHIFIFTYSKPVLNYYHQNPKYQVIEYLDP